ncbi:MAG: N-acetyltransferase [Anaerolineae bacterium]|nr:N-acetyltransferase [Anaerolineae bacterium]
MEITIQPMRPDHWESVREIYLEGIATRNATFETEAPSWQTWDEKHLKDCRLVALARNEVCGWVALSPVSSRCVYAGVGEHSIYVAARSRGQGVGRKLLDILISSSEHAGFWTLQTSIFPENTASLALHKACGFREVGRRERIGQLEGLWRDTILLERRSSVVGI